MPTQMQRYDSLIAFVHKAVITHTVDVELAAVLQDWQQSGLTQLAYAIEQLLNGERNPAVLLEPLNYEDSAIIHRY